MRQIATPVTTPFASIAKTIAAILDLHRFRFGFLRAMLTINETAYGSNTQRRFQA